VKIKESFVQSENETLVVDDKGRTFLVNYGVITDTTKGQGFIDYFTPSDEDETTITIEIYDCFICDDSKKNTAQANQYEEGVINEYLTDTYKD